MSDCGSLEYPPLKPYGPMSRIEQELEFLEMAITGHPLCLLREEVKRRGCITTAEAAASAAASAQAQRRVRVAGLIAATRKIRTQKGAMMQYLTLEDEHGLLEAVLFPGAFKAFSCRLATLGPYILEGKLETNHGAVTLNVLKVEVPGEGAAASSP